jgi:predicted O-methyltransferase YrrM
MKNIVITQKSLDMVNLIANEIKTFHHHYHILYDIGSLFNGSINYVEIGCYAGGSSCLMLQRENTNVIAIDIGYPIKKDVVINNVKKFNTFNNFTYIQGNSQHKKTIDKLKMSLHNNKIDILFIDGGHNYNDVIDDFSLYENLVTSGGFIVFDDYNDHKFSPEVKSAVDYLVNNKFNNYNIIGTIKNHLKAIPEELEDGNCFIIQKK